MKFHGDMIEKYLQENFHIIVYLGEYGWEGVLLYHEEIEEDVIPNGYLRSLIDLLLFHMTTYEDEEDNEWLFSSATHPDDVHHLLYVTCLKTMNCLLVGFLKNRQASKQKTGGRQLYKDIT